ncbi:PAS domain S-box-containing protein/diguanylate cyclase (GGDEF) domain-containing protein [Modicisalibacter ilicicola DSM 19980]|uniref:PAS domain S-box-containing protein/diguanylate cyclase (GGDEF) domain-containing protein n=1 Tax=Modicisalibacter ilicicola DSM 19980 TaxID=1121942 RepID=A0A1M4ZDL3_9GAMM|nr:EAL domain-containing protein [Halomonas ilicicola]SHF15872.1 PAS domain S-box-containing protein/diguanylate cyclase (GGDEF) domain-containing protein [Halomonas ilicicola DSM 19980]
MLNDMTILIGLVLLGAIQLLGGLFYTRQVIREMPQARGSWHVLAALIALFLLGYVSFTLLLMNQTVTPLLVIVTVIFAGGGTFVLTVTRLSAATIHKVRGMVLLEQENDRILATQQRLQTILDNAAEGIVTFDEQGVVQSFNKAAERLFGYPEAEAVGLTIDRIIVPPDSMDQRDDYAAHFLRTEVHRLIGHEGEVIGCHRDRSTFPMALKISSVMLEGQRVYTGLVADISERKAMLERLRQIAEHDGLTGLHNRSYFQQRLEHVVQRARRTGCQAALLYIDLDNFKYVNDTLGHAAGDRLLIDVARLLARRVRSTDLIGRFGGDEFTVLLRDLPSGQAQMVAEAFRQQFVDYVFRHAGKQIDIGCSIGVALIGHESCDGEEVLAQPDFACHLAKRAGRNRVHQFSAEDQSDIHTLSVDMGWSRRIKHALEQDRLVLAYQPIMTTAEGELHGYEVLVRLLDERDRLIMPSGFLPPAERFGLAVDIDRWVIANAIDSLLQARKTQPALCYSINLSAQTISDSSVCDLILQRLEATGLDPQALIFEVTETAAITDMNIAQQFLGRLREIGCRTALDDFGSGMSSFAYLKDLPVDIVKLDGYFVRRLAENRTDQSMVRALNEIIHALGKQSVAEFVEDQQSLQLLTDYAVDFVQGYYLGRPAPLPDQPATIE